jgi:hypothetical protein
MSEEVVDPNAVPDDDAAIAAEVEDLTKPQADQDRDKVKNALIQAKKELRESKRRVAELEPQLAEVAATKERLDRAQPIIEAVLTNPKLRAEALRAAQGTRPSDDRTTQPDAEDDPDAAAIAEDMGFYLADGQTPDIARGKRLLARLDTRHGRQTDDRIRPVAGLLVGSRAESNVQHALTQVDENGTPLATRESIEDTIKLMGGAQSPLLANPNVVDLILNNAIGLDRRKGRTPKAPEEPLYLDRQTHGSRRSDGLSSEDKQRASRYGISDKDYAESSRKLEQAAASRKAITFEGA